MRNESEDAEANITQFLGRHGSQDFLKLFLTNYLYDLVMYWLHASGGESSNGVGYRFFFRADGRTYPPEEVDRLSEIVRRECARRAAAIVTEMRQQRILDEFVENPKEIGSRLSKMIEDSLHAMLQ